MTVEELLEQLKDVNPDAEVMISERYGVTEPVTISNILWDNNEVILTNTN